MPAGPIDAAGNQDEIARFCAHFDHTAPMWNEHFHEVGAYMRQKCPVLHSDRHGGFWVVTRYDDVTAVATDTNAFLNSGGVQFPAGDHGGGDTRLMRPSELDPPEHRGYRQLLNPYFTKARLDVLAPDFRATADALIDEFAAKSRCDAALEFAVPFPAECFIDHLLNVPRTELPRVHDIVDRLLLETDPVQVRRAADDLAQWSKQLLSRRRQEPHPGDVVDALMNGTVDQRDLSEDEQVDVMIPLLIGGLDTTASVIGTGIRLLAENSELQQLVRADRSLLPNLVEEFLRLGAPATLVRTAARDVELRGQVIRRGSKVLVPFPIANRDPSQFEDPDTLHIDREINRHVTFGIGPHRCLGSHVARLSIRVAFEALLDRLDDIQLTPGRPPRFQTVQLRSVRSLPIQFRVRPGQLTPDRRRDHHRRQA